MSGNRLARLRHPKETPMTEHELYEQMSECANKRCKQPLRRLVFVPTLCDKCESELREAEEETYEKETE